MASSLVPEKNMAAKKDNIDDEIERLMDEYGNDVLRTSYMYLKDRHSAEDAFQEVFLRVLKKYADFKGDSSERTWLISITINVCKDFLKSAWIRKVLPMGDTRADSGDFDVGDKVAQIEDDKALLGEVMRLPPTYKDTIILHYYQGFDTVEIGKVLGISANAVRSRLFRAREILKERLKGRIEYHD